MPVNYTTFKGTQIMKMGQVTLMYIEATSMFGVEQLMDKTLSFSGTTILVVIICVA